MKIRDHLDVVVQPTVVRLDDLRSPGAAWITESFYVTDETSRHLSVLRSLFARETGCGVFLIGHYGAGKSHFLAYLVRELQSGGFAASMPVAVPISLLNFRAEEPLESIVAGALSQEIRGGDRRETWSEVDRQFPDGLVLVIDELSEFLRSKPVRQSFNEDLRFLQFLGEWAQDHRLWIVAALQEQIEHTGDIEYDLYRKIRDRYPVRLLLSPAHVKDLIAKRLLHKKSSYRYAVEALVAELRDLYPAGAVNAAEFSEIYPIHPATLEILEEVRDRFSQARGVVDFVLARLRGDEARGITPFLDQPWGTLLTPDVIVDHFSDLFEIQSEFLPIAQKVLPWYRTRMDEIFDKPSHKELAWKLVKLLILAHLSPRREGLSADEAAHCLLLRVSRTQPARNREIVRKTLEQLAAKGAFVVRKGPSFRLDLEDQGRQQLDALIARTVRELEGRGDSVFETLIPCLERAVPNPFEMPRDRWHTRKVRWHFHDRDLRVYFGGGQPAESPTGPALQVGVPWGPAPSGERCFTLLPGTLGVTPEILELAALVQVKDRPLSPSLFEWVRERLHAASDRFAALVHASYGEATFVDPGGAILSSSPPRQGGLDTWLQYYGELILRRTFPLFEKFAPVHGPLPREAFLQFMRFAADRDLCAEDAPDYVKLIREAYLVPLGLMHRKGSEYRMEPRLDGHELVRHLAPVLQHHPTPARVYEHMSAPVYGLLPDQIHLLLLVLLVQGEIDILMGRSSYRDTFETATNPLQYDRIVPGNGLNVQQLKELETLCSSFRIPIPRQWSVLAQRRAIEQLRSYGRRQRDQLGSFLTTLREQEDTGGLAEEVGRHLEEWLSLEKGEHELQGFQHFLFEAGSAGRFVARAAELSSLPLRLDRLLRESRRLRHLTSFAEVRDWADPSVGAAVSALGTPPSPAEPAALEGWIRQAERAYQQYRDWYREAHERWRESVGRRDAWTFRPPVVARSRHVGAAATADEMERLLERAQTLRCMGLGPLDFQPRCRCGFDGRAGPVNPLLDQLDELRKKLESELTLFFGQEKVRERVRDWVERRIEINDSLLSFVEGKAPYPATANLELFDQHLAGLELVRTVPAAQLVEAVEGRTWDRPSLIQALDRFLERFGPRLTIRREDPGPRKDLVAWCCEVALRLGRALPEALSEGERGLIPDVLRPDWIAPQSLARLGQLGLGEAGVDRVLELLLKGAIPRPTAAPEDAAVAAALDLMASRPAENHEELADRIALLYREHARFRRLRPGPWVEHLHRLAEAPLPCSPLTEVLAHMRPAQWVVIDALGVPLLRVAEEVLRDSLPRWKVTGVRFALGSLPSSTDAFYRDLAEKGLARRLEKIDAVDALLHNRRLDFSDLVKLARTEIEIGLKRVGARLDRMQPVVVFGDHGFRLAVDGSGFCHGGPSMLERTVPVFELLPVAEIMP